MKKKSPIWILIWVMAALGAGSAILAVAGFGFSRHALEKANQVSTLALCTELEHAVQRFYDDNGTLPVDIDKDVTFASNSEKGLQLLNVLFDLETSDMPMNVKGIKYLMFMDGSRAAEGLTWNESGTSITGLYDPWGGEYQITLDGDFDNYITVQPKAAKEPRELKRRVAVWSDGNKADKAKDDVTTW